MLLIAAADAWELTLDLAMQVFIPPQVDVAACGSFMRLGLFIF